MGTRRASDAGKQEAPHPGTMMPSMQAAVASSEREFRSEQRLEPPFAVACADAQSHAEPKRTTVRDAEARRGRMFSNAFLRRGRSWQPSGGRCGRGP